MADDSDLFEFNPGGAFIQSSNDGIIEDIFNANEDLFLHEDHTLDIEQEGEPEGGDELAELTPLTTSDTTPLLTRKIEFSSYLPEYPETHEDGFTYVEMWKRNKTTRGEAQENAISVWQGVQKRFEAKKACADQDASCSPKLKLSGYAVNLIYKALVHCSVYSARAPEVIMSEIFELVRRMQNPDLTLATFLKSKALSDFCLTYNKQSITQINKSFTNMDRIAAIIKKAKLLNFPEGQDFNGVLFEWNHPEEGHEYIQNIYQDEDGTIMIICFLEKQAQLLLEFDSFEIDMSYKRIKSKQFNEVVFAKFLQAHNKVFTLLRVFTNKESPHGYQLLFERVFATISRVLQKPVNFFYLHRRGFKAIVMDMDAKQMTASIQKAEALNFNYEILLSSVESIL
ncbi:TPA_exp: Uncharacterized protein A8136_2386 [Trichophyton benhamiae CBS 112371]|nr:TPA_exp: Uncharacterized protein A8136_2386 [Trichophyton benhamiae CBS 112371]